MPLTTAAVIQKARDITGNHKDRSPAEIHIPDEAIQVDLASTIRLLNKRYGLDDGLKEVECTAVANQQDYTITSFVGSDVQTITEVLREGAHTPETVLGTDEQDYLNRNLSTNGRRAVIPSGYQQDVFDSMVQTMRYNRNDRYSWEIIEGKLRLFPKPSYAEKMSVRYISTGASIASLPNECETTLVYAACRAIIDCILNRMGMDRATQKAFGDTDMNRIKTLSEQRDRYSRMMNEELANIR